MWDETSLKLKLYHMDWTYTAILKRAVEHEEKHRDDPDYPGWVWSDVKAHPAQLMKLVAEDLIEVNRKGRKSYYKLVNRELIKKCLEFLKSREKVREWLKELERQHII